MLRDPPTQHNHHTGDFSDKWSRRETQLVIDSKERAIVILYTKYGKNPGFHSRVWVERPTTALPHAFVMQSLAL